MSSAHRIHPVVSAAFKLPPVCVVVLGLLLLPAVALCGPPEVVWRTHTGDAAAHGAVLLDGRVYVTSTAKITELDPATGKILRFLLPPDATALSAPPVRDGTDIVAGDAAGRLLAWSDWSFVAVRNPARRRSALTAVLPRDGGGVYAAEERGCVLASNPDGTRAWSRCTGGAIGEGLAANGDRVLAGDATGRVTAWDAAKGGLRWSYTMDAPLAGAPLLTDAAVYLAGTDGHLYKLDRARGALRWRVHLGDRVHAAPAVAGGLVVVATEGRGLVAINTATGRAEWRAALPKTTATPAILGNLVVVGASDHALHAFQASTGAPAWHLRLDSAVIAPPLLHDDGILLVTEDGVAYCLR